MHQKWTERYAIMWSEVIHIRALNSARSLLALVVLLVFEHLFNNVRLPAVRSQFVSVGQKFSFVLAKEKGYRREWDWEWSCSFNECDHG